MTHTRGTGPSRLRFALISDVWQWRRLLTRPTAWNNRRNANVTEKIINFVTFNTKYAGINNQTFNCFVIDLGGLRSVVIGYSLMKFLFFDLFRSSILVDSTKQDSNQILFHKGLLHLNGKKSKKFDYQMTFVIDLADKLTKQKSKCISKKQVIN